MTKLYCKNPLNEYDLQWKTTFNGWQTPVEDDLQWKTTYNQRRPPMEDNLQWKTTSNGRQPPMEDIFFKSFKWRQPQNIKSGMSQQPLIGSYSWPNFLYQSFKIPQDIKSGISQQQLIGSYSNLKLKLDNHRSFKLLNNKKP
jgi:hypothetical protein